MKVHTILVLALLGIAQPIQAQQDPYLWLEEVDGQKSLKFAEAQSEMTLEKLSAEKDYQQIFEKSLEIYNSSERIAYSTIQGDYVYNFWKDKDHVRGIWRRTLLSDYMSGKPNWETLLDIDELSKKEDINWVYKEASGLYPSYDRFLVSLSKGGGDAVLIKEFDVNKKGFIENGYFIDEAKGSASYVDENTLIVSTDFGDGTMTTSSYPRQVKLWKRGTLLEEAQLIYEGESSDVGTWGYVARDGQQTYSVISQALTTLSSRKSVWLENKIIPLDIPEDADTKALLNSQLVIQLKSDWKVNDETYKTGNLISLDLTELLKGNKVVQVIIDPDALSSVSEVSKTKNKLLVNLLTDVTSQLYIYSFSNGKWTRQKIDAPDYGTISVVATNDLSDRYFFDFQNFITPSTLYSADASNNTFNAHKSLPAFFDANNFEVGQFKAESKDGTMIPYFLVAKKDLKHNCTNPTIVYAYGGFGVSQKPFYASSFGMAWLDKGGVYVLANIRGGGEYGPQWHQDGMKEKRQKVFDDLYAVSEELIAQKITSPKNLGVIGGSNGGLLVGVLVVKYWIISTSASSVTG